MTGSMNVARVVFAGAIVGSCAFGLAARADASPCDPATLAMTPQPQLSCPGPDAAPPPDGSPVAGPVTNIADPPPPGALPVPVQQPSVPPVVGADGTQSYGQLGYLRQIWHDFHNGVPSDLFGGPPPSSTVSPPAPGDPLLLPPPPNP
jgi:hypothetical protein